MNQIKYRLTIGLKHGFVNDKVLAIKTVRNTFGFALKEAKDFVEFYKLDVPGEFYLPDEIVVDLAGDHIARQLWKEYERDTDSAGTEGSWFWIRKIERFEAARILDATEYQF
jgi:hypothetical protein